MSRRAAPSTLGLRPTRRAYIDNLQLTRLSFNWLHPSMQPTKIELSNTGKQNALMCNLAGTWNDRAHGPSREQGTCSVWTAAGRHSTRQKPCIAAPLVASINQPCKWSIPADNFMRLQTYWHPCLQQRSLQHSCVYFTLPMPSTVGPRCKRL